MKYTFTLILVVASLLLLLVSPKIPDINGLQLSQVTSSLASFIFASAIFSFYFDLRGREEFTKYIWREAKAAFEAREGGLIGFTPDSMSDDLAKRLAKAKHIRYTSAYSSRFLKRYEKDLEIALRRGCKIEIIQQAEDSPTLKGMIELGWKEDEVRTNLSASEEIASRLLSHGDLKLYRHRGIRAYSCTIIDTEAFFTLAKNSNGRGKVPRFVCESGGSFFEFIECDWVAAIRQSKEVCLARE